MITKTGKTKAAKKTRTRRPRRPRCMVTYIDSRGDIHEWELVDEDAQTVVKMVRKMKSAVEAE